MLEHDHIRVLQADNDRLRGTVKQLEDELNTVAKTSAHRLLSAYRKPIGETIITPDTLIHRFVLETLYAEHRTADTVLAQIKDTKILKKFVSELIAQHFAEGILKQLE